MINTRVLVRILLVQRLRKKLARKKRSCYVRQLFMTRNCNGELQLVKDLRDDPLYHFRYFRMTKDNFDFLLGSIKKDIAHKGTHARPISPLERLAITYLASGNSQVSLAMSYRVSPSSVCLIIRETLTAIIKTLQSTYLPQPTQETWTASEARYRLLWNFPHAVGAIDGKHIRVKLPPASGSLYYNYKGFYSIALLAIANADFQFQAVDIGAFGSESDGGI
ncbi:uncharacterized protein LOC110860866 [Folsomia candida]|uniref:uncharacterized protein LOC110860866 n=1 Tax=Folsomia candida TaxID=158441 RepID=UPI000B908204|nr:uncharacterized protein LOC110860866 [Folsomia candida]